MLEILNVIKSEGVTTDLTSKFFHGLSNPARLKIAISLLDKEKSVSELMDELGMKQAQISNQLSCLKHCGFVSSRQEGKYVYYKVTDERVREIIKLAYFVVADNASQINSCTSITEDTYEKE
jgi:DNA-binding transcriptional ArsR family regulator